MTRKAGPAPASVLLVPLVCMRLVLCCLFLWFVPYASCLCAPLLCVAFCAPASMCYLAAHLCVLPSVCYLLLTSVCCLCAPASVCYLAAHFCVIPSVCYLLLTRCKTMITCAALHLLRLLTPATRHRCVKAARALPWPRLSPYPGHARALPWSRLCLHLFAPLSHLPHTLPAPHEHRHAAGHPPCTLFTLAPHPLHTRWTHPYLNR